MCRFKFCQKSVVSSIETLRSCQRKPKGPDARYSIHQQALLAQWYEECQHFAGNQVQVCAIGKLCVCDMSSNCVPQQNKMNTIPFNFLVLP